MQVIIMVEAAGAASSSLQYPPLEKTNREQLVSAKFSQRTLLAVTPLTLVIVILNVICLASYGAECDEYIRIFEYSNILVANIYSDIRAIFNTNTYSDIRSCQKKIV